MEITTQVDHPGKQGVKRKSELISANNVPTTVAEFNEILLRMLECPICTEYMSPPLIQCENGHLVCSSCRTKACTCPVCRSTYSKIRNRAMEGVAEALRYPCRLGCDQEVLLQSRDAHEANCPQRLYECPLPGCFIATLPYTALAVHFQNNHASKLKHGNKHNFALNFNMNMVGHWIVMAMEEFFYLYITAQDHNLGLFVYVTYIGPKKNSSGFIYKVMVAGKDYLRRNIYIRTTHSDLENITDNIKKRDCFHMSMVQVKNFLEPKDGQSQTDKMLVVCLEISKSKSGEVGLVEACDGQVEGGTGERR